MARVPGCHPRTGAAAFSPKSAQNVTQNATVGPSPDPPAYHTRMVTLPATSHTGPARSPERLTPGPSSSQRSAPPTTVTVAGVCHGTLGELFQGPFLDGAGIEIAIVSLPLQKYSWAYFTAGAPPQEGAFDDRPRCRLAVALFCARYAVAPPAGRWEFHTEIRCGVGMASSTADVVATLRCLFGVFGIAPSVTAIRGILSEIERADSVFLDEAALYLSRRQRVVRPLGAGVAFSTCYAVEPGAVDTESLSEELIPHYGANLRAYDAVREELVAGFRAGDRRRIAAASTRSAVLSQVVVPKTRFTEVLEHRKHFTADGVVVAHTGTVLGYLFADAPSHSLMNGLSAFFRDLGLQCSFARCGF